MRYTPLDVDRWCHRGRRPGLRATRAQHSSTGVHGHPENGKGAATGWPLAKRAVQFSAALSLPGPRVTVFSPTTFSSAVPQSVQFSSPLTSLGIILFLRSLYSKFTTSFSSEQFRTVWGKHAHPQCLLADTVPIRTRTWTLRPPATLPQNSTMPCHSLAAVGAVGGRGRTGRHGVPPQVSITGSCSSVM